MDSASNDAALPAPGCPIRRSSAHSPLSGSPKLFAASHVLHRLLAPRHPPCALSSLTIFRRTTNVRSRSGFLYPYAIVKDRMTNPWSMSWIRGAHHSDDHRASKRVVAGSGADRNRTDGLRLAKAALSQLSYIPGNETPVCWWAQVESNYRPRPYQGRALAT